MSAYGAHLRCLLADYNVAAVTAFPYNDAALFEHLAVLNIRKKCAVAFLVLLFNLANAFKKKCDMVKAFCTSLLGKGLIHIRPFVVFAFCGGFKVFDSCADAV